MIDDAAAMATGGWPIAAPAQVVECATLDAQQCGSLVDGEEGELVIVIIVEHGGELQDIDAVNLRATGGPVQ